MDEGVFLLKNNSHSAQILKTREVKVCDTVEHRQVFSKQKCPTNNDCNTLHL